MREGGEVDMTRKRERKKPKTKTWEAVGDLEHVSMSMRGVGM